jgi:plastocyanin
MRARRSSRSRATRALLVGAVIASVLPAVATSEAAAAQHDVTLRSRSFLLGGFHTIFPKIDVPTPNRDGYITRMDAHLADEHGRRVSIRSVMMHHVVFLNRGRPGGPKKRTTCEGRSGEPFWGTGEERQRLVLPAGYGYQVKAGERWRMQVMLMSHGLKARDVHVEYTVRLVTGRTLQRVKPLWLRANGCEILPEYDVDGGGGPGSIDREEHMWTMPLSGRIVAAGAHLHGSAKSMTISQPRCGDRTLVDHQPLYGHPSDLVYRIRPVLHEPGPIATGYFLSKTGIPVRRGEKLRVSGFYDGSKPHPRVMAITHVYIAVDDKAPSACDPLPADGHVFWTRRDGVFDPPVLDLPLNGLDKAGRVVEIERPPGAEQVVDALSTSVDLRRDTFAPANLSVPRGAVVTWRFVDRDLHNVLLASGPRSIASTNLPHGSRYTVRLDVPGEYKLFCYLHPLTMHQVVRVRE